MQDSKELLKHVTLGANVKIHPLAIVGLPKPGEQPGQSPTIIGENSEVGPFSIVYAGTTLGKNTKIQERVTLGHPIPGKPGLVIGDDATIRSGTDIYCDVKIGNKFQTGHKATIRNGNIIGDEVMVNIGVTLAPGNKVGNKTRIHVNSFLENTTLGNEVFIAPHVMFTDDPHPICPRYEECKKGAIVEDRVSIGGNSTIMPGVKITHDVLVGGGSVVTKDLDIPFHVYAGNPAKLFRRIDELPCYPKLYEFPYSWRGLKKDDISQALKPYTEAILKWKK